MRHVPKNGGEINILDLLPKGSRMCVTVQGLP